jgi:hypothetical protein
MPRAYFLLSILLRGSQTKIHRHAVGRLDMNVPSLTWRAMTDQKVVGEFVKFWGSLGELILYLIVGCSKSR